MKQTTKALLESTNTAMCFSRMETFLSLWNAAHTLRMQSWPQASKAFIDGSIQVIEKQCLAHFEQAYDGMTELREALKDDLAHYTPKREG